MPAVALEGVKPFIFARNCNLGIRAAGSDDVVLLNDDALLEYCRNNGATIFHPSGTCKMGLIATDPMAVVDARLRVHGMHGLRVIDCSVMPTVTTGNTNVPVVMMAEKAADLILADAIKSA